ncbi:hypothetical protein G9A89_008922 [Geosiphon pyriformis]|nr:hypothetical protein G9A89_008922 [Geosiphon pyriformis]
MTKKLKHNKTFDNNNNNNNNNNNVSKNSLNKTSGKKSIARSNITSEIVEDLENLCRSSLSLSPPPYTFEDLYNPNDEKIFKNKNGNICQVDNSYIIFTKVFRRQLEESNISSDSKETLRCGQTLNKVIGKIWRSLSDEEKDAYKNLFSKAKALFEELYPKHKQKRNRQKAFNLAKNISDKNN